MHKFIRFFPIFIFLFSLGAWSLVSEAEKGSELYIKDGDSFVWGAKEIRLWGIDAPELFQICQNSKGKDYNCGRQARAYLKSILDSELMRCEEKPRSKRETRIIAQCFVKGMDLAKSMVLQGWAIDYTFFSNGFYELEQIEAKKNKRGVWAGSFQTPRKWRKAHPR